MLSGWLWKLGMRLPTGLSYVVITCETGILPRWISGVFSTGSLLFSSRRKISGRVPLRGDSVRIFIFTY